LTLAAKVSLELEPINQSLKYLDLKIDALESQGAKIENASLKLERDVPGELYIGKIQYDKAKILEVKGKTRLDRKGFSLDAASAKTFDGEIRGDLRMDLGKAPEYLCHLKFVNLDLDRFAQDFNLKEKFQASGKLVGELTLKGSGADIKILSGDFSAVDPGGRLTVTDDKFLKNVAQSSGESLDILVESFTDYHYNTGIMKLSLEGGNIVFNIALEGEAGKRNLSIVLHDFKLGSLVSGR